MTGFIKKYILPREVDFQAALLGQAAAVREIIGKLYQACVEPDPVLLEQIRQDYLDQRRIKNDNMQQLLKVFITPYDKESIYRLIVQLDWIALSTQHFVTEIQAYGLDDLQDYKPVFTLMLTMSELLEHSIRRLSDEGLGVIAENGTLIHDQYNDIVSLCASASARLMGDDDIKHILVHKDIIAQLREVAKRMHITANTLEDLAIKTF